MLNFLSNKKILLHGNRVKFLESIAKNGLYRESSAFFNLSESCSLTDVLNTLIVAVYHGISLEVQKKIIDEKYDFFYNFYKLNLTELPVLILFDGGDMEFQKPDKYILNNGEETCNYFKVSGVGKINAKKLKHILKLSLKDIYTIRSKLDCISVSVDGKRFFIKKSISNVLQSYFDKKAIDKDVMFVLCQEISLIFLYKINQIGTT